MTHRIRIPATLAADYLIARPEKEPRGLVLLLHGYLQSGASLMRHLEETLAPERARGSVLLAPNAPFPIPRQTAEGRWELGFSWYFYNPDTDEYFIDMEIGVHFLLELLERLQLGPLPTTIIGFSQGGYLAPFLAQRLPSASRVIGIGCEFLIRELALPVHFRMDGIHGARDERVSPERALEAHEGLVRTGVRGEFVLCPESGHRIDPRMKSELRRLLGSPGEGGLR